MSILTYRCHWSSQQHCGRFTVGDGLEACNKTARGVDNVCDRLKSKCQIVGYTVSGSRLEGGGGADMMGKHVINTLGQLELIHAKVGGKCHEDIVGYRHRVDQ